MPNERGLDFSARNVDSQTGTLSVRGVFPNPGGLPRPGEFARVRFIIEERPATVLVLQGAATEVLDRRPDVRQAEKLPIEDNANIDVARAQLKSNLHIAESQRNDEYVRDPDESARLSKMRYSGGVTTCLEVLPAQQALFSEQLPLAHSRGNEFPSVVQLYRALGGGRQQ